MHGHEAVRADDIDRVLPQTQCTKCGHAGCRPYAEAIARGAAINRCPPGGAAGIARLAALTGRAPLPLDAACGAERARRLAWIDPALCIGCTKCIQACPVDAIIGASRRMHTVLASQCTGCDLCVAPCPVDCIEMRPLERPVAWTDDDAARARAHHVARQARQARERRDDDEALAAKALAKLESLEREPLDAATMRKRAIVQAAIERARARRAGAR